MSLFRVSVMHTECANYFADTLRVKASLIWVRSMSESSTPIAVGLDIGGTKIAGGLVTANGRITSRLQVQTLPKRGGEGVFNDSFKMAESLIESAEREGITVTGIGIGLCELVDLAGTVSSDQTIKWRGVPVRERFSQLAPTVIEADCRAQALCEARLGAGREFPTFLYVTIGTGVSCTLIIDGQPYRGARGATGTIATQPLSVRCDACGEMSRTALEKVASGPGLVSLYNELATISATCAEDVLSAAANHEPKARRAIDTASESLGGVIGLLVNTLDPQAVVIGGGLGSAAGYYWQSLEQQSRRHIWSDLHRDLPIIQAHFGADAGLVGAGLTVLGRSE